MTIEAHLDGSPIDEQFFGTQQRALDVAAALVVSGDKSRPGSFDRGLHASREIHEYRVRGQIVEQCIGRIKE
jgi:hypothetical protein